MLPVQVAGTTGTIRLDDFVIPREERKCGFTVTGNHGLREMDTYDGTEREEKIVSGGLVLGCPVL